MRMRSRTGAATRAVRSDIARNPAERAASASERPNATGRARETQASAEKTAVSAAGSQRTGSRSAARLSATPPIAATGSQRKNRRSSTSRASAPAKAARQSGAKRPRAKAGGRRQNARAPRVDMPQVSTDGGGKGARRSDAHWSAAIVRAGDERKDLLVVAGVQVLGRNRAVPRRRSSFSRKPLISAIGAGQARFRSPASAGTLPKRASVLIRPIQSSNSDDVASSSSAILPSRHNRAVAFYSKTARTRAIVIEREEDGHVRGPAIV